MDAARSNMYKGNLSDTDMRKLLSNLKKVNWDTIIFPDVICCDAPVKTLVLSLDGKQRRFKSMTPPVATAELMKYLTDLAVRIDLPVYSNPIGFQEY